MPHLAASELGLHCLHNDQNGCLVKKGLLVIARIRTPNKGKYIQVKIIVRIAVSVHVKLSGYIFEGSNTFSCLPSQNRSTLKEKNLLP